MQKLSANYNMAIKLKRVYYASTKNGLGASAKVGHAVADGVDDMSEPYYYLGGAHDGKPRIESMAFSCITAGLESFFFTPANGGIDSTDKLFAALVGGENKAVGFIGSGNYDSVSHLLPPDVDVVYKTNSSDIEALVQQPDESAPARSAHPATRGSREPLLSMSDHPGAHPTPTCMPPQHRYPIRRSEIKLGQSHPAETLHAQLARPP